MDSATLCTCSKERIGHHPVLEGSQLSFCETDVINSHTTSPYPQAWIFYPSSRMPCSLFFCDPNMPTVSFWPDLCHICVQGEVGWGFEQLDLVEGIPAHGRGG